MEYLAYRILFTCLQKDLSALNEEILLVTPQAKRFGSTKHAMMFVRAYFSENHWRVALLTRKAPNLGASVISLFLPSLRFQAYRRVLKSYVPGVPFDVLGRLLHFSGSSASAAAAAYVAQHNGSPRKADGWQGVDCRTSLAGLERLMKQEAQVNPQFADLRDPAPPCGLSSAEEDLRQKRTARFAPGGKLVGWN